MKKFIIRKSARVPQVEPRMDGVKGALMRTLLGEADHMPSFHMREFTIAPGGHTPLHQHPYEHEVYILEGRGVLVAGGRRRPIEPAMALFVPSGAVHQFRNTSRRDVLRFLCLIPADAMKR
jgi:quercetin dioxygenase-like cupin family protein